MANALRFHKSLYSETAIRRAAERFAQLGEIEVTEADERRVHRLRLHPPVVVELEASSETGD